MATVRVLTSIVIVVGAWILLTARPVNTAGNAGTWFIGDLEPRSQADITTAYDNLCRSERERIEEAEFVVTRGADYSVLGNFGVAGTASQHAPTATLDGSIKVTWEEYEVRGQDSVEIWRIYLVREPAWWDFKGDWKICGIEFRDERPAD